MADGILLELSIHEPKNGDFFQKFINRTSELACGWPSLTAITRCVKWSWIVRSTTNPLIVQQSEIHGSVDHPLRISFCGGGQAYLLSIQINNEFRQRLHQSGAIFVCVCAAERDPVAEVNVLAISQQSSWSRTATATMHGNCHCTTVCWQSNNVEMFFWNRTFAVSHYQ